MLLVKAKRTEETHGFSFEIVKKSKKNNPKWSHVKGLYLSRHRSRLDHEPTITCTVQTNQVNLKRPRVRGKTNLVLLTTAMKSPPNASSIPLLAPRDMDTAGQLSHLYSHVTTLSGQYLFPTFLMLTENTLSDHPLQNEQRRWWSNYQPLFHMWSVLKVSHVRHIQ